MSEQQKPMSLLEQRRLRALKKDAAPDVAPTAKKEERVSPVVSEALRNDERYKKFFERIPLDKLPRVDDVGFIQKTLDALNEELEADPGLREAYTSIILEGNTDALKRHGIERRKDVDIYWEEFCRTHEGARERLPAFEAYTHALVPTVGARRDFAHEQFVSPRIQGSHASFGPYDFGVQADRYVYASFDGIQHYMTTHASERYALDEATIEGRAELVMQDIANIAVRANGHALRRYLDNCFSYTEGKQILARYLAMVFKSPEEAGGFLEKNNHPQQAQQWDRGVCAAPPIEPPVIDEAASAEDVQRLYREAEDRVNQRKQEIEAQMQAIYREVGLEPPLSVEVRIPDRAQRLSR